MSIFSELKRRNVLRVAVAYFAASWLIVQVADTIFPVFGLDPELTRIVVIVLVIGLVPVLIFTWLYEFTPEGLKLETDVDRTRPRAWAADKRFDRGIIVILTLAVGYFALDKFVFEPARDAARDVEVAKQAVSEALAAATVKDSIAVLPFANMGNGDDEYLSDGISEELRILLAQIPQLRVISRSSAFSFKDTDLSMTSIAQSLNVNHVLEGTVRRAGNSIRITANLIDARTDSSLWSNTFERNFEDVFATQNEIATSVVDQLKLTLLNDTPTVEAVDPQAYTLFLQARFLANQFTPESMSQAIELFQQALAIEPGYANAWSSLGWVYANQVVAGQRSEEDALQLARESTWTALAINPDDARAYANVGWIAMYFDSDFALAARHYGRAMSLDPNDSWILNGATVLVEVLGRSDEALSLYEYGIARDPVNANRHMNFAAAQLSAGRYDGAIASARTVLSLSPARIGAQYIIGAAQLLKGDAELALATFEKEGDDEYRVKGTALALHELGRQRDFQQTFDELRRRWGEEWPSEIAQVYAWVGDSDAAFEWLNKSVSINEGGLMELSLSPFLRNLQTDPRWDEFLSVQGQSADTMESIEFSIILPQ